MSIWPKRTMVGAAGLAGLCLSLSLVGSLEAQSRAQDGGLRESSFHFPEDGAPNQNGYIGPFCCTGQTATVHDPEGRPVGYAYFFGWVGQAHDDPFRFPELEILVSGAADLRGDDTQQKSVLRFVAEAATPGSSRTTQAGALYFRATLEDFSKTQLPVDARPHFRADSLKVKLDVSTAPFPAPVFHDRVMRDRARPDRVTRIDPSVLTTPVAACTLNGSITGKHHLVHEVSIVGPGVQHLQTSPDSEGRFHVGVPEGTFKAVLLSGGKFGLRATPGSAQRFTCRSGADVEIHFDVQGIEEG